MPTALRWTLSVLPGFPISRRVTWISGEWRSLTKPVLQQRASCFCVQTIGICAQWFLVCFVFLFCKFSSLQQQNKLQIFCIHKRKQEGFSNGFSQKEQLGEKVMERKSTRMYLGSKEEKQA